MIGATGAAAGATREGGCAGTRPAIPAEPAAIADLNCLVAVYQGCCSFASWLLNEVAEQLTGQILAPLRYVEKLSICGVWFDMLWIAAGAEGRWVDRRWLIPG